VLPLIAMVTSLPGIDGSISNEALRLPAVQARLSLLSPNPATPAITRAFDGGFNPGHDSLELALNLANNTQAITVTLTFSALYTTGVSNVSFKLFDIDYANADSSTYQDVVRSIKAISTTGASIAPTITGVGPNLSLTGTGLTQALTGTASTADTGAGSGRGNATISFNSTAIQSVRFTYKSSSAFADPSYQHIGIDNIKYAAVPEPSSSWCGFIGGAMIMGLSFFRRLRRRAP
jgi:hypothetical protein